MPSRSKPGVASGFCLPGGEVLPNNVAQVTHSGEGIQACNTYYEVRLSNYEANYASSC
ncbi:hypothetical protein COO91_01610 [Nostoc flagelliforme CCNUN1]|uniref:Uncharacterized protein n=1 Tax=Nostoc flagelliforme CCNUN1 TaxID=2038116 RepID=A0A2K8SK44_9NOSO|nr:hypothetical protein [Nostoc flagelliforme]AUB35720.1 hypothetical protein COO91_01610 [Nostoc flagelliforme CCNUN1]